MNRNKLQTNTIRSSARNCPFVTSKQTTGFSHITGITYGQLVELLGQPTYPDGFDEKTQVEWDLVDGDGNLITIYDFHAAPLNRNTHWSIGGSDRAACDRVRDRITSNIEALA